MKQNYNSAKHFGTEIDLLWQSMFSTHFLNKYKGLNSLQRLIFRTISKNHIQNHIKKSLIYIGNNSAEMVMFSVFNFYKKKNSCIREISMS